MHHGIMRKMTELYKMTTAKKNHQGQETLELVYSLHMFLSSWCCDDVNSDCLCFYSGQGGEIHRAHTDDVNRQKRKSRNSALNRKFISPVGEKKNNTKTNLFWDF